MEKRYQIFISSTYSDLINERQQVLQTLLQMDCIPTGMELFPAADEEQFEFIKKVIDDCDYYILIIGGRYGSITSEGISYTEAEFDYAVAKGIHVIALVHGDPDKIPAGKTELDPKARDKLDTFREKVCKNRLVKKWSSADELSGLAALSLIRAIKTHPAVGWVRADAVSNTELLEQLNEFRQQNDALKKELELRPHTYTVKGENLMDVDESIEIKGLHQYRSDERKKAWNTDITWNRILAYLGPHMIMHLNEEHANSQLAKSVLKSMGINADHYYSYKVEDEIFQTIKIQMMALGWIDVITLMTVGKIPALFWILTELGKQHMIDIRSLKKPSIGAKSKANKKSN